MYGRRGKNLISSKSCRKNAITYIGEIAYIYRTLKYHHLTRNQENVLCEELHQYKSLHRYT
jgi:hypothetical protein